MNLRQSQLENAKGQLMSQCGHHIRHHMPSVQPVLPPVGQLWDALEDQLKIQLDFRIGAQAAEED